MRTAILSALFVLAAASTLHADELSGRVVADDGKPLRAAHVYVYMALPRSGPMRRCRERSLRKSWKSAER